MDWWIYIAIIAILIVLVYASTRYKKFKKEKVTKQTTNYFDNSNESFQNQVKANFNNNIKPELNDPKLKADFKKLFNNIHHLDNVNKFDQLANWAHAHNINLSIALTLYELENNNPNNALSIDLILTIIFSTLWQTHREDFIFKNNSYQLQGDFFYFKNDHDNDASTPDIYAIYFIGKNKYGYCGCYKLEEIPNLIKLVAGKMRLDASQQAFMQILIHAQILNILGEYFHKEKSYNQYDLKGDHYQVLGVNKNASLEEIKKAYRQKAKENHPDVNKSNDANKKMMEINKAYEILSSPELRREYDQSLN